MQTQHRCQQHGASTSGNFRESVTLQPLRRSRLQDIQSRPAFQPWKSQLRPEVVCAALGRSLRGSGDAYDLVLSSGFLAFAAHSGFLQAVEDAGVKVGGVMGTSAGALAGSLYCAGYTPRQVAAELSRDAPIQLLQPSLEPWKGGAVSLDRVVQRLRELLPARFEDLDREFAVGVVTADGQHVLVDSGPLPEAVAASAAIPFMFQGVDVPGFGRNNPMRDGGVVDRIGLKGWRDRRRMQLKSLHTTPANASALASLNPPTILAALAGKASMSLPPPPPPPAIVHVIARSSPFSGADDTSKLRENNVLIVRSPRSGVNLLSLGDFEAQMAASYRRARPVVEQVRRDSMSPERRRSRVAAPV